MTTHGAGAGGVGAGSVMPWSAPQCQWVDARNIRKVSLRSQKKKIMTHTQDRAYRQRQWWQQGGGAAGGDTAEAMT
jgi:hypothetical protein